MKKSEGGFQNDELSDAVRVGGVAPDEARIWMRTSRPGQHRIVWWPFGENGREAHLDFVAPTDDASDNTHALTIPGPADKRLQPLMRYGFRVTSGDHFVGEGSFQTAPASAADTPETFSFAIMSCNQPFDSHGRIRPDAREMLRATRRALDQHDCKFILFMGDQMYSDTPVKLSLFNPKHFALVAPAGRERILDCTTEEVRKLYQHRYRHFWNIPELHAIVAHYPCYTILDDHDIVDNWGSHPDHLLPEWQSLGAGARWAYYDYQTPHLSPRTEELPSSFQYELTYGHSSIFVMDLRSERWIAGDEGRLYSHEQGAALDRFLKQAGGQKAVFIVLSVPPVHLPRSIANTFARITRDGEDFSDRWSSLAHIDDLNRFMKRIRAHQREHPGQRIVFLSGDIHVGCAHELVWEDGEGGEDRIFQLISSGLTNRVGKIIQMGARWLMRLNSHFDTLDGAMHADVRPLEGVNGREENPYAALNMGVVQVHSGGPDRPATLEYFLYGHDGDEPVCVFQTEKL